MRKYDTWTDEMDEKWFVIKYRMASIRFSLNSRAYFPCDKVKGRLSILTKVPCMVDRLDLVVNKACSLEISKKRLANKMLLGCGDSDGGHRFSLALKRELCAGEHVFPFSFVLSGMENASGRMNQNFGGFNWAYSSVYQLEAVGIIDGEEEKARIEVPIYNRLASIPYVDIKFKINGILCLNRSVYLYRIVTDRTFYKTGDMVYMNCFPTSVCARNLVSEIGVSLHEIALYRSGKTDFSGDRVVSTGKCQRLDKNEFKGEIRIPFNLCGTVIGTNYSIQTVIEFDIHFHRGWPIKIKKYIDIGKSVLVIPEVEEIPTFGGIQYNEVFLEL